MTKPTRRKIERQVEEIEENSTRTEGDPLIIDLTSFRGEENSPHPELTVQAWPDKKPEDLALATPSVIPEEYATTSPIMVVRCDRIEKYIIEEQSDSSYTTPCELWDLLSEEQLEEEYEHRKEHGEPIPEVLAPYAPE